MTRALVAVLALAAACSDKPDPWPRLARHVPAAAGVVVAVDGARLRASWLAASARALKALLPADRACVVDAAIDAERAMVGELASGRIVVIAGERGECTALSQVERGIWVATLGGAQPVDPEHKPLRDRPDWPQLRAAIGAAPIVAIAPDGEPALGVTSATLALGGSRGLAVLDVELDGDERAASALVWLEREIESAAVTVGEAGATVRSTKVTRDERRVRAVLAPDPDVAATVGPQIVVAAIAAAAASRRGAAVAFALACPPPAHGIACEDGVRFTVPEARRADVIVALDALRGKPRINAGQIDGFRLRDVGDVVAALGLRDGDIIRAIDDERVDDFGALGDLARKFAGKAVTVVIERDGGTAELRYIVGD